MATSFLKGKHILAVDDEKDIIETIQEILDTATVDSATDYETASEKIYLTRYDLAILDIMGVNGIKLLEECVKRDIPAIMLTANAMNPQALMESIKKGALSYLPKEHLSDLDTLIEEFMDARNELGDHFDLRFGDNWKDENRAFWDDFEQNWSVSRGIQERLRHNPDIMSKGI
ncbi:MAG: response regulator [Desulfotignum sp.]